jgi:hypothetical protein
VTFVFSLFTNVTGPSTKGSSSLGGQPGHGGLNGEGVPTCKLGTIVASDCPHLNSITSGDLARLLCHSVVGAWRATSHVRNQTQMSAFDRNTYGTIVNQRKLL